MTDRPDGNSGTEGGEELVVLATVQGEPNARILAGVLESEGIEAMLKTQQTFSALPFTVDGMGEVRVLVRAQDLERAKTILAEYREGG